MKLNWGRHTLWVIFVCKTECNVGNGEWPERVDGKEIPGCWVSTYIRHNVVMREEHDKECKHFWFMRLLYMYVCMDVCMYKEMFFAEPHGLSSYGPMIYLWTQHQGFALMSCATLIIAWQKPFKKNFLDCWCKFKCP